MLSFRRTYLLGFVLSCAIVTLVMKNYPASPKTSLNVLSSRKLSQSPGIPRQSAYELNHSSPKLQQLFPKLKPVSRMLERSSGKLDKSSIKRIQLSPKPNYSSQMRSKLSNKAGRSFSKHNRIFNTANIKPLRDIFPNDSRPAGTLYNDFVIENAGLCSGVSFLVYIIVVHSAPDNFERRQSMRLTWTQQNLFNNTNSQRIFLLGKTLNSTLQGKIIEENKEYGDIVQGDFIDHYRNLTLKAVMGLKWITNNCHHANYVIKVDDDVFVNIFQVKETIFPLLNSTPMQVICSVEPRGWIFRTDNATSTDKWTVSRTYFVGQKTYPMPFCYGYATFYTTALASELLNVAYSTPFYRLDDVYVYGILMSRIKSASWRDETRRYFKFEDQTIKIFPKRPYALVGTTTSQRNMERLWTIVSESFKRNDSK